RPKLVPGRIHKQLLEFVQALVREMFLVGRRVLAQVRKREVPIPVDGCLLPAQRQVMAGRNLPDSSEERAARQWRPIRKNLVRYDWIDPRGHTGKGKQRLNIRCEQDCTVYLAGEQRR